MKGALEDSAIGSAVPNHVSLQQKQIPKALLLAGVDVSQSEFLALLLEESFAHRPGTGNTSRHRPGVVTWQSHDLVAGKQQPVPVEGGAMVGCKRERVEPSKELIFDSLNPMSFLNTDLTNATSTIDTNANANINMVQVGGGSLLDCMLDSVLGSSSKEMLGETVSETSTISSLSFPLFCQVAANWQSPLLMIRRR